MYVLFTLGGMYNAQCLQKQAANLQEGPHVRYILDLLQDAVNYAPGAEAPTRIPSFTTLLLAHALRAVFYPANFIYPLTSRFLLQRPEVDVSDVPLLYGMLYSSSDEWKKERAWMLKFLADAVLGAGAAEWDVFRRRRTWDLLASLWQSGGSDRALRTGILEVRLLSVYLLLGSPTSGHIDSAQSDVQSPHCHVARPQVRALGVDGDNAARAAARAAAALAQGARERLDGRRHGQARTSDGRRVARERGALYWVFAAACRCVHLQTSLGPSDADRRRTSGSAVSGSSILLEARVLLRLAQMPGPAISSLGTLLSQCTTRIEAYERSFACTPPAPRLELTSRADASRLHTSYTAQVEPMLSDTETWGRAVVALWRVAMALETKTVAWDALSARVLLWRAVAGDGCVEGEWVRREAVRALGGDKSTLDVCAESMSV
jgi:nucleolar pre-ribosomal-associated protein 1